MLETTLLAMDTSTNNNNLVSQKVIVPGVYDLTNEEYHSSPGISSSKINLFLEHPKYYWDRYINKNKPEDKPTESMLLGSATHTYLLEPHLFDSQYTIAPKINRQSNAGKAAFAEFVDQHQGKYILTEEQLENVIGMAASVKEYIASAYYLKNAKYEKSIYWYDEDTKILCRARPDIWREKQVIDLKTTNSASERDWKNSIYYLGYHRQAAMYLDAVATVTGSYHSNFMHICVEKKRPWRVEVYILDDPSINRGRDEYKQGLKDIQKCLESKAWHGSGEVREIGLPNFVNYL